MRGPLLIGANHPNSFLDAIIVSSLFKQPIYSLARGDAFAGKFLTRILMALNMLPVYRVSEGVENLDNNYTTFEACQQLFKENKIVLIFSEGRCINEWHLRPIKKGTARLAFNAWRENIPLQVLPLGLNYSSFRKFGKIVRLNFGSLITEKDIFEDPVSGKAMNEFNHLLNNQLKQLVYEIDVKDKEKIKSLFEGKTSFLKKVFLFLPALLGFILHAPLYYLVHNLLNKRAKDHYDSIMVGIFFLFYPVYLLLLTIACYLITQNFYSFGLIIFMPLSALALLHYKKVIE